MGVGCRSGLRRLGAASLLAIGSALACVPASACLIEYNLASETVPLRIDAVLSSDTRLPITQQIVAFDVITNAGTIAERRQEYAAVFANYDAQQVQLIELLTEVLRAEQQSALAIVRNIGGASSPVAQDPVPALPYSLVFALPGGQELVLPLDCVGVCDGSALSQWGIVGYIDEPPGALLLVLAAGLLSWFAWRPRRATPARSAGRHIAAA